MGRRRDARDAVIAAARAWNPQDGTTSTDLGYAVGDWLTNFAPPPAPAPTVWEWADTGTVTGSAALFRKGVRRRLRDAVITAAIRLNAAVNADSGEPVDEVLTAVRETLTRLDEDERIWASTPTGPGFDALFGEHAADMRNVLLEAGMNCCRAEPFGAPTDPPTEDTFLSVEHFSVGVPDELSWVTVARINHGWGYVALVGGCDYTGWGCHGDFGRARVGTLNEVTRYGLSREERARLGLPEPTDTGQ